MAPAASSGAGGGRREEAPGVARTRDLRLPPLGGNRATASSICAKNLFVLSRSGLTVSSWVEALPTGGVADAGLPVGTPGVPMCNATGGDHGAPKVSSDVVPGAPVPRPGSPNCIVAAVAAPPVLPAAVIGAADAAAADSAAADAAVTAVAATGDAVFAGTCMGRGEWAARPGSRSPAAYMACR